MSKISNIHDKLHTLVGNALSDYKELPDPYELDSNPDLYMKHGFGISVNGGDNDERSTTCHRYIRRSFIIKLVRKITTTKLNKTSLKSLQKELLEDQELVNAAIRDDITLTGEVMELDYVSDGGINYIDTGRNKYFAFETTVEVLYSIQD